jgi:type I restriction enzyme, S subunit
MKAAGGNCETSDTWAGEPSRDGSGWPKVPLADVIVETQYGTAAKATDIGRGQPVLRMNNLTYDGRFDTTNLKWVDLPASETEKLALRKGDLLFNRTNSRELVGKTGVWNGPDGFTFAGYLVRVRLREDCVLPGWVAAFLNSTEGKTTLFHMAKPSINMANIGATDLLRLKVPIAPLDHQRRAIALIDKADAIRRKRKEAIALTEELLRSAFLEMFGDPVTNPRAWPVRSVTDLCASKQYGTAEKANTERRGLPVLRMNNITYAGDIDISDLKWVELSSRDKEKLDLQDGDVLFNRVNSHELVGKTAAWHGEPGFTFAGYLIRLRTRGDAATGDYLSAAMNMQSMKRRLMAMAKPSINMANISGSDLDRILLPVPPPTAQRKYDALCKTVAASRKRLRESATQANTLFNSLVAESFQGARVGDVSSTARRSP